MSEITQLASYDGSCHCGAVTFTVKTPSLQDHNVMSCNCASCVRNGYLMIFPERKNVLFHSGYDKMSSYVKNNVQKFCSACGSSIVSEAKEVKGEIDAVALNVRMIKDINVDELKLTHYDGKAAKPEYDIGKLTESADPSSTSTTASKNISYPANCYCGAVRFTVRIPSLTDHEVTQCNCSICTRNGYLFVYPEIENVSFQKGYDYLHSYSFGLKSKQHKFCPTCGSSVVQVDWTGSGRMAVNVRMFQDIDLSKLEYTHYDGKSK